MPTTSTQIEVRWMTRNDRERVIAIEQESFDFPWSREDFAECMIHKNVYGVVALHDGTVVGYAVYQLFYESVGLLNLAVDGWYRRQGVGRELINHIKGRFDTRVRKIIAYIVEHNVGAQLFLRACGFKCEKTMHDHYEDTDDDAYLFEYRNEG